jgi:hypothetical protein
MLLPCICTRVHRLAGFALLWLLCTSTSPLSQAASIETLVMPGQVISAHADVEHECSRCHGRFDRKVQNTLCLDCHKAIAKDLQDNSGFHGRLEADSASQCSQCHSDHLGRDADITRLVQESFDHNQTDFELNGAHQRAACGSCHKPDEPRSKAPSACIACHKKDDVHQNSLGEKCQTCHNSSRWSQQTFDHNSTRFALKGAHVDTQCAACHPDQRYKNVPRECVSCHRGNDVHLNAYGNQCNQCHNSVRWIESHFDHSTTDFALDGAHTAAQCSSCHPPAKAAATAPTACVDCHRVDDIHKGRNGDDCNRCHSTKRWKSTDFDHTRDTDFPLVGKHGEATCLACHAGKIETSQPVRACIRCHRSDDIHRGELGETCNNCHNARGWLDQVRFDHDLTGFPLYGQHGLAPCESCHQNRQLAATETDCNHCHAQVDKHKGALGEHCATCHNANSWTLWRFDHDTTDFPLTGKHQGQSCDLCHTQAPADKTPGQCVACHRKDDAHRGGFGNRCERCHSTEDFRQIRPRR